MSKAAGTETTHPPETKKQEPKGRCQEHHKGGNHVLASLQWNPVVRHLGSDHKKALWRFLKDEIDSVLLEEPKPAKASSKSTKAAAGAKDGELPGCEYLGVEVMPCTVDGKAGTMRCQKYDCGGQITYACGTCTVS